MIKMFAFMIGVVPWQIVYRYICKAWDIVPNSRVGRGLLLFQWVGVVTLIAITLAK